MNNKPVIALTLLALLAVACAPLLSNAGTLARVAQKKEIIYLCPMHKDVRSKRPGNCPKCGMRLREADEGDLKASPDLEIEERDGIISSMKIPDVMVLDQDGKPLHFYSDLVRGKTVAINFIFTTCTTICPPLTATFRKVQQELGNEARGNEARGAVELISVSVDPTTDVPERLKEFAARFKAAPGWSFITGNKTDIDNLLKALGAFVADKNDHTPMILVGNERASYWTRTYGLASPSKLVELINEAARKTPPTTDETAPSDQSGKSKTPDRVTAEHFPNLELPTQQNRPVHLFDNY